MTHETKMAEMNHKLNLGSGQEALERMSETLARAVGEIDKYRETYLLACKPSDRTKPEDVLGWAVNYVACIQGNMRLDLFVSIAADIANSRAAVKASGAGQLSSVCEN